MSGVGWNDHIPLSPSSAGRIEYACDRFEAASRAGERLPIEDDCDGAAPPDPP